VAARIGTVDRVSAQSAGAVSAGAGKDKTAGAGVVEPAGHRERLIAAMAAAIVETGYRDTTVADVVRLARTSRRNFYEHFEDRDGCFLALFDATNNAMMDEIAAAVDPDQTIDEQVDHAIDAYIGNVTKQPVLYASFVRELPGLGKAGADRGLATLEGFAELLVALVDSGRREQPDLAARSLAMDTAIIIVGGLRELAVISLQRGRDVRELRASAGATIKAILAGALL
jgi:AcrR family transcriptional regulator